MRRNSDELLRDLERKALAGDPRAVVSYVRERHRRGLPVTAWELQAIEPDPRERLLYLIAAREEVPGYSDLERAYRTELGEVNLRAMTMLRSLSPRIRRSRRSDLLSLEIWAVTVVGQAIVDEAMGSYRLEASQVLERHMAQSARWEQRRAEIDVLLHQVAWKTEPQRGTVEDEFKFNATATHATVGLGAGGYARDGATHDAVFLASQGFDSRIEHAPGRRHESVDLRGRPYSYVSGDGYRVFVLGVLDILDAEILRLRLDGWTFESHYFGHDEYFNGSITREQQSAWMSERFQMLGWDPQPGRERECCPMTVERMKQIYKERGPLRPSWLLPN